MSIPILFGTETGNSEYCAETLVEALEAAGHDAEVVDDVIDDSTNDAALLYPLRDGLPRRLQQ